MGTDKHRQFGHLVARLTGDRSSPVARRRSRPVLITLAVLGALAWGLLSVSMVAWGAAGVVLACCVIGLIGAGIGLDAYRRRSH